MRTDRDARTRAFGDRVTGDLKTRISDADMNARVGGNRIFARG